MHETNGNVLQTLSLDVSYIGQNGNSIKALKKTKNKSQNHHSNKNHRKNIRPIENHKYDVQKRMNPNNNAYTIFNVYGPGGSQHNDTFQQNQHQKSLQLPQQQHSQQMGRSISNKRKASDLPQYIRQGSGIVLPLLTDRKKEIIFKGESKRSLYSQNSNNLLEEQKEQLIDPDFQIKKPQVNRRTFNKLENMTAVNQNYQYSPQLLDKSPQNPTIHQKHSLLNTQLIGGGVVGSPDKEINYQSVLNSYKSQASQKGKFINQNNNSQNYKHGYQNASQQQNENEDKSTVKMPQISQKRSTVSNSIDTFAFQQHLKKSQQDWGTLKVYDESYLQQKQSVSNNVSQLVIKNSPTTSNNIKNKILTKNVILNTSNIGMNPKKTKQLSIGQKQNVGNILTNKNQGVGEILSEQVDSNTQIKLQEEQQQRKASQKVNTLNLIDKQGVYQNNNDSKKSSLNPHKRNTSRIKFLVSAADQQFNDKNMSSYQKQNPLSNDASFLLDDRSQLMQQQQVDKKFAIEDFELICEVGKGSFGCVKLMLNKKDGNKYAVKCISKDSIKSNIQIRHILNERNILRQTLEQNNHHMTSFCVTFYESIQDEDSLYFIFEFLPGGELFTLIRKNIFESLNQTKFYLAEIIVGLEKLHAMDIIYRDLKPENILIDKDGHVKLIDFGFSKKLKNIKQDRTFTNCGSPGYTAPEVMLNNDGYNYKVDIWSIGILICDMVGGYTPFSDSEEGNEPKQILERIRHGQMNLPRNLDNVAKDLVRNILVMDPNLRFEIDDIKKHKFFKGINWESVTLKKETPVYVPPEINIEKLKVQKNQRNKSLDKLDKKHINVNSRILGDFHLQKINKVFVDF